MTERDVFLAALEFDDPAERSAYLDRACAGDPGLRDRAFGLLQAHEASGEFMDRPAGGGTITGPGLAGELVGTRVGPFKLLQVIGEGGFGVVYMAEQERPVSRRVALKVIKPGMDSDAVLARFEAERQALAMMDHPNIAQVLDAGATESGRDAERDGHSGRPYFVMELVKGVPVTEFCDKNQMPPADRLRLFISVCRAVQHAHQKGIIHRDLKPSNVLVTLHDGVPVPKVIDFGVAKATAQKLTERTLFTAYGQMVGTPTYMSPEQAEMSGLDVDTRSDIYSLGVLLYELLTGTTPIPTDRLRTAGYAELQRLIREQETPRPSNRVSTLGESATIVAGNRGTDPRQLARQLAGDLDWIVLTALAKDRNRRYESAGAFAADVERYLRGEPILARPPSAAYRVRKFVRRNRATVGTAAAVAAALVAGTAVSTWQAVVADRARADALASAEAERTAKAAAEAAAQAERAATRTAERRAAQVRASLDFVQNWVLAAARPRDVAGGLGHDVTLRAAIEAAVPHIERGFPDQPLVEAMLRWTLGWSFTYLGDAPRAADQFRAAHALYARHLGPFARDTLDVQGDLAGVERALGRPAAALARQEEVLGLCRTHLGPEDRLTIKTLNNLATAYLDLGRPADALARLDEALPLFRAVYGPTDRQTLRCLSNRANCYHALRQSARAAELHEEALALRRAHLGPDDPDTFDSMHNLANAYYALDRKKEALDLREKTLAVRLAKLGPDNPDTLKSMHNLAISYEAEKRHAEARDLCLKTLERRRALFPANHPDTLASMSTLAATYKALGQLPEALKLHREALAGREKGLGPTHRLTLWSMFNVAACLIESKRGAEAVPIIDECVRRAGPRPDDPELLPRVVSLRFWHFRWAKDAAGLRGTAELWEGLGLTDAEGLYTAAKIRAVAAAVQRATDPSLVGAVLAGADDLRAVDRLRQAVAAGWTDTARMGKDPDFAALRHRADFRELTAHGAKE